MPRAPGAHGYLHGLALRKFVGAEDRGWRLECGHIEPVPSRKGRPRKMLPCSQCPKQPVAAGQGPEVWRAVVGWEGLYSVSSHGNVRRDERPDYMLHQPIMSRTGYVGVRLTRNNVGKTGMVATLVSAAFLGPKPAGKFINHIDGNKHNNAATNLEYVTRRANEDHAVEHALHAWGTRHGMVKLTEAAVRQIRTSSESTRTLADRFHVGLGCIRDVLAGRTWRHLA